MKHILNTAVRMAELESVGASSIKIAARLGISSMKEWTPTKDKAAIIRRARNAHAELRCDIDKLVKKGTGNIGDMLKWMYKELALLGQAFNPNISQRSFDTLVQIL